jgi:hypothetical protein
MRVAAADVRDFLCPIPSPIHSATVLVAGFLYPCRPPRSRINDSPCTLHMRPPLLLLRLTMKSCGYARNEDDDDIAVGLRVVVVVLKMCVVAVLSVVDEFVWLLCFFFFCTRVFLYVCVCVL